MNISLFKSGLSKSKLVMLISYMTIVFLLFMMSCNKEEVNYGGPDESHILIRHFVDNESMEFDTAKYYNAAGNNYAVENLNYYLSDLTFYTEDGRKIIDKRVHYINGRDSSTMSFYMKHTGIGHVTHFTAILGVSTDSNIFGILPPTQSNQNMLWPAIMGGGYHFMKFEGRFLSGSSYYGFAVHLGKNGFQSQIHGNTDFYLAGRSHQLDLNINMNEVFNNPYSYDLDIDGNYTMGDSTLMKRISNNSVDILSIHQNR
ncbi:hypothetical protein BH09BAC5_BH09BAC5_07930 [soil metagenome]